VQNLQQVPYSVLKMRTCELRITAEGWFCGSAQILIYFFWNFKYILYTLIPACIYIFKPPKCVWHAQWKVVSSTDRFRRPLTHLDFWRQSDRNSDSNNTIFNTHLFAYYMTTNNVHTANIHIYEWPTKVLIQKFRKINRYLRWSTKPPFCCDPEFTSAHLENGVRDLL